MLAPQAAQERALNEVGRIDEKYLAVLNPCLFQQWLQRVVEEMGLSRRVFLDGCLGGQRDRRRTTPPQSQCLFKNRRT